MLQLIAFITQARSFAKKVREDCVNAFAAQAAFFIILSFIPFTMLLMTLIQYVPQLTKADVLKALVNFLPDSIDPLVINIVDEVYNNSRAVLPLTAITALWSAGRGVLALVQGFNSVYDVNETRNFVILRVWSAIYTVLFTAAIIVSLGLVVFGKSIQRVISIHLPLVAGLIEGILSVRMLITLPVLIIFFCLIYKVLPNKRVHLKNQLPGAIFSSVAWLVFSYAFSIYVDRFHGFQNMYGSLTTIVIVMFWLYICMYIVLLGGELNASFEPAFSWYYANFSRGKKEKK